MSASSSNVLSYLLYPFFVLVAAGIGTGVVKLLKTKVDGSKEETQGITRTNRFIFGTPATPKTGAPAEKGWATIVNAHLVQQDTKLDSHGILLEKIGRSVATILAQSTTVVAEVTQDGNGGHNLRGIMQQAADAASTERERLHEDGES